MRLMHSTYNILNKKLGRPPTEVEVAAHKREKYLKYRETIYAWRRKKEADPAYWAAYLEKCKQWRVKRQARKGKTVKPFFKHPTEESRLEARRAAGRKYNESNAELRREQWRKYARNNKHKTRIYQRNKRANDPLFNMAVKLRKRLKAALNLAGARKSQSSCDLVGCTMPELKQHIESQFTDGMTWDLFCTGQIHLEHKIPCAAFNLLDEDQQKKCFHYTNLCPSWPVDNLTKSSVYNGKRWYYSDHVKQSA